MVWIQNFLGKKAATSLPIAVRAGSRVSSIDSQQSGTGPYVYNETTVVKSGAQISVLDVFGGDIVEVTTVRAGQQFNEFRPTVFIYDETTVVQAGARARSLERVVGLDRTTVRFAAQISQSDILIIPNTGTVYIETTRVNAGTKLAGTSQLIAVDRPTVQIGIRPSAQDLGVFVDSPVMRAGIKLADIDGHTWSATSTVRSGGQPASTDRQIATDGTTVQSGVHAASQDVAIDIDRTTAHAGTRLSSTPDNVIIETTTVRTGTHLGSSVIAIGVDASSVRSGTQALNVDTIVAKENTTVRAGIQLSSADIRAFVETTIARLGARLSSADLTVFTEQTIARLATQLSSRAPAANPNGLIPAIRRNTNKTLPELTAIPEALPENAQVAKTLIPPYLVIVAGTPVQDTSFGVHDQAHWVHVDLVYVAPSPLDGVTDKTQDLRSRLGVLVDALLADYTQTGGLGVATAATTEVASISMERVNDYQKHFREIQQPVTVMVSTIMCLVVESTAGA